MPFFNYTFLGRRRWIGYKAICFICIGLYIILTFLLSLRNKRFTTDSEIMTFRRERYLKYKALEADRDGPGEQGEGVTLSEEDEQKYQDINIKEGFNYRASQLIALDRSLPDYRRMECMMREYPKELPKASVVIVFNNEAFSVIMRTVHSVVNRSPPQYLQEVLLVDDNSDRTDILQPMYDYIAKTWPDGVVRVIHTPDRYGVIKSRLFGAQEATGEVLIFLDAHCEVTPGWIEPLLNEMKEDPTRMVCPLIDGIDMDSLEYKAGEFGIFRGVFGWNMLSYWEPVPERDLDLQGSPAHAYRSPTMVGGLFAATREFFFRIGAFDDKMECWGGENLDLSFRAWMCGGSLLFHPCSIVGHIFRKTHPYVFPDKDTDYYGRNTKRVVEVWMDEYKKYYYLYRSDLQARNVGDLSERIAVREREKCHPFQWYLDNVYPEKFVPDKNVVAYGQVRNPDAQLCLDKLGNEERDTYVAGVYGCNEKLSNSQVFSLTPEGYIRREYACLTYTYSEPGKEVHMEFPCNSDDVKQIWKYDKEKGDIQHQLTGLCLDANNLKYNDFLVVQPCDDGDTQHWEWTHYYGMP